MYYYKPPINGWLNSFHFSHQHPSVWICPSNMKHLKGLAQKKTRITAVTFRVLPVNLTVVIVKVALFKRWNMFIIFSFWVTFSTMWAKPATSYCSVASDWKYFTLNSWAKSERRNLTTKSSEKSGGTTMHEKGTRLAPTRYKWGYNPSKWRFFG